MQQGSQFRGLQFKWMGVIVVVRLLSSNFHDGITKKEFRDGNTYPRRLLLEQEGCILLSQLFSRSDSLVTLSEVTGYFWLVAKNSYSTPRGKT